MTSSGKRSTTPLDKDDAVAQETVATVASDSQSIATVGSLSQPHRETGSVSLHETHLPITVGAGLSASPRWRSTSSLRSENNRRTPALSECSRMLTPVPATHRMDMASVAVLNTSHRTPSLPRDKYVRTPNYNTGLDARSGAMETDDGSGDSESEEDIDIHSLGERLTDVLERSLRGESFSTRGEHRNTLGRAVFHIFKGNVGAGVFLLPTYYQDAGYGVGCVIVILLGILMIDCALALVKSKQKINLLIVKTYPAVVGHVFGKKLKHFTNFSLIFTQFGFCVVYIQYASSMFTALFTAPHAYHLFVFLSVLVVTPMTFFSHRMGALAYGSMLAAVFVIIVLAFAFGEEMDAIATHGVSKSAAFFVPTMRIIVFISGHMFSLEGIGTVLPVENSMSEEALPKFATLVKYTLASVVTTYLVFGVLGYLAFGDALQTSVVLVIPPSKTKIILQVLLGLSLIFSYPIQFVPAIQLVDRALGINVRVERGKSYIVRVALNVFFGALAGFIGADTINLFASFLGAFTGVHLMVTLPALLALFTDHVSIKAQEGTTLSFCDYAKFLFTLPDTLIGCRWHLYLLLALTVWICGTYYTFASVFG